MLPDTDITPALTRVRFSAAGDDRVKTRYYPDPLHADGFVRRVRDSGGWVEVAHTTTPVEWVVDP